ncbi:MGMT family protein [Echinicola vietnamensis]|uniref:Putative methylated DNA-protein cysteine methyltransferase n=1 Tax=Echinicola vietnamensis (strain DSM 17526 / LMG 23754 / KMM 6221) TaxID=926556 RepID=L0FWG3_ECHVK|nr:MGMT family protein [Echinicola vietnamensis]AGA78244.1 putative methylated DNA-protein cysteine methyltransferase [Echinicola vietnamensis DSM 17526]
MKTDKENFFDLVYQVVRLIPKGRVSSYGAIANYLGAKSGARTVGYAMNAAHTLDDVPAHRVVNSKGLLTGKAHFSPPEKMQRTLEAEGVIIKNDQVVNFQTVFWDPSKELEW